MLITGPSKTGKTTLYTKVLSGRGVKPITVRCDNKLTATEFWKRALERLDFGRVKETKAARELAVNGNVKIAGGLGWGWLAKLTSETSGSIGTSINEDQIRERILADPSPDNVVPVLKHLPFMLVVEDFHYMASDVQETVFQQWKNFIDNQISVIVVGTTHHAIYIARSNKDLLGRICQIDISRWTKADLKGIIVKGFQYCRLRENYESSDMIAAESAGLPIITQQACRQLFLDRRKYVIAQGDESLQFTREDTRLALYNVAKTWYTQHEEYYVQLKVGPRKRARKYNTYELVLSCFTLDPLKFSLSRHELDERLAQIARLSDAPQDVLPAGSVTSTLNALETFQRRKGIELLEWRQREKTLYILEPSFLFYLRWRTPPGREQETTPIDELFKRISDSQRHFAEAALRIRDIWS